MAAGATRTFKRASLLIPRDASVASADLSPLATASKPSRTAAGSNPEKLGEAARLVLQSATDDASSFSDLILPTRRFVGDTTGPAPR